MYYDKAFEQAQKMESGGVLKIPEPTNIDCLYDIHYKCVKPSLPPSASALPFSFSH
jgi:hypothetical protein